jgi:hypothetical protein
MGCKKTWTPYTQQSFWIHSDIHHNLLDPCRVWGWSWTNETSAYYSHIFSYQELHYRHCTKVAGNYQHRDVHYPTPRSMLTSHQNPVYALVLSAKAMYKYEHFTSHITFYYFVGWSNNGLNQGYPKWNPQTNIMHQLCSAWFLLHLKIK